MQKGNFPISTGDFIIIRNKSHKCIRSWRGNAEGRMKDGLIHCYLIACYNYNKVTSRKSAKERNETRCGLCNEVGQYFIPQILTIL